jgi:hypothetical protein
VKLQEIDRTGLIREAYRMKGVGAAECRTIFLDWALKLPPEVNQQEAIALLLETYGKSAPKHPMTAILRDGLGRAARKGRRGGARARRC